MVRHFVEMLLDILTEAADAGPIAKTRLMLRSRLTHKNVTPMIGFLVDQGLLEEVDPPRVKYRRSYARQVKVIYRITVAGKTLLRMGLTVENPGVLYEYSRWKRKRK